MFFVKLQILEESYSNNEYKANIKILYNDIKVKKFLSEKNISFSQPENISAVFFPVLYVDGEIKNLNETKAAKYRNKFLGFVFQSFNLINYKNAVENVSLPRLKLYGRKHHKL